MLPPRLRCSSTATKKGAIKISEDSHYFIGDEILLRDRLEYDPSRVLGGNDKEDEEEDKQD